ncbi:MAG: purine-nucleoside phosphorylase [Sphingobacteriales bacterium]|nr:MAG: purine-nucleoside phosphorylase [Sphingobacteriales bacterium]
MSLYEQVHATVASLQETVKTVPEIGIILGSGLGDLANMVEVESELPYTEILNFPHSTVEGHVGKLIFGTLAGKKVVMMAGRFHYYEGYDMYQVTFPVRVMQAMGVHTLIVSNAAGGMKQGFTIGDIMLINDHINLFPEHPLRGPNDERLGTRFPDMMEPYSFKLLDMAKQIAKEQGLEVQEGVYAGLSGPTFETKAEYKWLSVIGADAVGMSTVPEVIVAKHGGMQVFAASIITDVCIDGHIEPTSHELVLQAANAAAPKLAKLVHGLVERI